MSRLKKFVCSNCQQEVKGLSAPLHCSACGAKRIGLFREVTGGSSSPSAQPVATQPTPAPTAPQTTPGGSPPSIAPPPPPGSTPTAPVRPQPPTPTSQPVISQSPPPPGQPLKPTPPAATSPAPPPKQPTTPPPPPSDPPKPKQPPTSSAFDPPPASRTAPPNSPPSKPASSPSSYDPPPSRPKSEPTRQPQPSAQTSTQQPSQPLKKAKVALSTVTSTGNAKAAKGELVWRFPVLPPGQEELPAHHGRVALADDLIIAMLGQKLVALKEVDGHVQVEWEEEIDTTVPASPVIGSDKIIRVHGNDGRLHGYDLKGKRVWPASGVGQPLGYAHPLMDAKNNTYICNYDGGLILVDATGARGQSPFFRTRERFDCTGLLKGDLLFIGGEDGFLHALDLSGRKAKDRWDADAGEGKTGWFINSAIAPLPDGGVVVCCRDEHVYIFNDYGEQQAKIEVRGQMLAAPVIDAEGNIFVTVTVEQTGKNYGYLACVSSSGQKVRWEHKIDRAVESTPVITSAGSILFGDNGGTVHSVSSAGREEWTCLLPAAVRSAGNIYSAEVDGKQVSRVIFGLDDGTLAAISIGEAELASAGWPRLLGL